MTEMDKRIGVRKDGKRRFPELDVNGQPVERNGATVLPLGGGFFCVLPRVGKVDEAVVAELRASLDPNAPPSDATKKKG